MRSFSTAHGRRLGVSWATLDPAVLALAVVPFLGCAHSGTSEAARAPAPSPTEFAIPVVDIPTDTVVVPTPSLGRVVIDQTNEPLADADARLLDGGPRAITDLAGRFTLHAPASGTFTLHVRRIGYLSAPVVVRLDPEAAPNTVVIRATEWKRIEEQRRLRLLEPTAVTPCRPNDSTAREHEEALLDYLDPDRSPYPSSAPAMGLTRFMGQRPRHIVDRGLCARAVSAIDSDMRAPGRGTQVHLYRIGRQGYAAYDPSIRDGEWGAMYWFDRRMRLLVSHQW